MQIPITLPVVPDMSTPADRLNLISQQGLCIGCGLCEAIAGPETVRCTLTPNGYERPVVVGELDHDTVDRIYDVCPGIKVTGGTADDGGSLDEIWGPWHRIALAWAADPEVRHIGSTGGALTALGMHLLDTNKVDAILHAGPSSAVPGFGEAWISRSSADVLAAAGSRYGPTAVFTRLEEVLVTAGRVAVIAKPCDLSALRLRAAADPRIDAQVLFKLTMVCGGIMAPDGLAERMDWFDIEPAEVTGIRYRGHGCPGDTVFERGEKEPKEINYLDFWGDDESKWIIPYRCKVCPDGTGEVADVAAADTWPGGAPTEEMLTEDPGSNVVIARTAVGRQLMEEAMASGHLACRRRGDHRRPEPLAASPCPQEAGQPCPSDRPKASRQTANRVGKSASVRDRRNPPSWRADERGRRQLHKGSRWQT